jgi:membrane-bound serine protease (ClpP class)
MTGSEWDDARERGETVELVTTIVPRGKLLSLSAEQALKYGLIDGIADKLPDVLTKLGAAGVEPIVLARTRSEDLAALLDALKVTLLAVGLLAIYWEFKTPGFGIPGIVAIVCFALFLFGRYLVGLADVWEMAAVVLGLVLIAVEIFLLPGQLWPGLVGAVLVLAGLVSVMVGPGVPWGYPLDRELLLDQVFRVALGLLAACVGGLVLSRFLPRTPVVRRLVLAPAAGGHSAGAVPESFMLGSSIAAPGARGTALTDLRPVGKVALDHDQGREFEARANGTAIDRGARVQVVEVQSGRLVVELEGVRSERG